MNYLRTLIVFLLVVSCNKTNNTEIKEVVVDQDALAITKGDIEAFKHVEYVLDTKSKNTLGSWQTYTDLMLALEDFKKADFKFFVDNEEIFVTTLDELETTIPEEINTSPIKSRLLVLKTKLYKLKQQLELTNSSKEERLKALKAVFVANENVTLQINKKYEKEAQKIIKPY